MTPTTILLLILLLISWAIILWLWRTRQSSAESPTVSHAMNLPTCPCALLSSDRYNDALASLLQSVISSLDSGLVIVDRHARICLLNTQAETILGVKNWVVRGHGLIKLTRDHTIETIVRDVLHDGEGREMTIQTLSHERIVHVRCTRLTYHDHQCGVVILIRDITRINMLERSRNDMIANVSHELRTPLTSLKLLVETLQSDPPAHIAHRMHTQMAEEVDAINHLVDDLHELSQLIAGRVKLQLTPHDIGMTIAHTLERIHPQVERKQIVLKSTIPLDIPPVLIDEIRIGQVLLNLLHNAIEYTSPNGTITVAARSLHILEHHRPSTISPDIQLPSQHPAGEWVLLSVQDTGIGIPSHDLTRIFERFYKVDRARSSGGSGLGLAIAKHLVEGHGGRLWAESEEGCGSIFFFTLPIVDK